MILNFTPHRLLTRVPVKHYVSSGLASQRWGTLYMNEDTSDWDPDKFRRKIHEAYECAGCARQDGDKADEQRWLKEAERLRQILRSL